MIKSSDQRQPTEPTTLMEVYPIPLAHRLHIDFYKMARYLQGGAPSYKIISWFTNHGKYRYIYNKP